MRHGVFSGNGGWRFFTEEALIGMGVKTVENALAALDGALDPELVVNKAVLKDFRKLPSPPSFQRQSKDALALPRPENGRATASLPRRK